MKIRNLYSSHFLSPSRSIQNMYYCVSEWFQAYLFKVILKRIQILIFLNMWFWRRLLGTPWTARRSNQSILNEIILSIHWKDWCWSWSSSTLATWYKELTHLKRPWYWERLRAGGEGDDRGWDGWMASPTRWTWVWVDSGCWWWTGRPGMLRFMES